MIFRKNCEWFGICLRYDRANDSLLLSPFTGPSTNTCSALLPTWNETSPCRQKQPSSRLHIGQEECELDLSLQSPLAWVLLCSKQPVWRSLIVLCCGSKHSEDLSFQQRVAIGLICQGQERLLWDHKGSNYLLMKPQVLTLWFGFLGSHLTCSWTPLILLSRGKCLNVPPRGSIF